MIYITNCSAGSISKLKTSTLFIEWKKKKPTSSKTTKKKCGTEKQNSEISAKLGTLQAVARVRRGVYEGQSTSQADQQTLSAGNDSKSGDSMLNHLLDHRYFSTYDIPKGQTQTTLATQIKSSGCLNSSSGFYTSYNVDAIQPPPRQPLGYYQVYFHLCLANSRDFFFNLWFHTVFLIVCHILQPRWHRYSDRYF